MRTFLMALAATLIGLALLPGTANAASPSVTHFRYAIDTAAGSADYSQTGARNKVLVLQSYQVPLMQRLKAANPSLKILIYKDLSGMVERDQWGGVSTGVATQDAAAHPEWFLQNTSGQRFTFRYYNWIWAADVGNAGYQQKWADNVLAEMGSKGWDGVFMDDTNPSMEYHYDVARVAKYPTDAAYQAATGSALAAIGARFSAAGKLVVPNFGFWKDYPSVINGWLRHVDGGMNENFVKVGSSAAADSYDRASVWESQLQSIKDAEAQGKLYLGVSHSPTTTARPLATATRRCCWPAPATRASRCTATTPTRTGSRSTTTRSARRPPPRRATPAASTGASSPTASCSSTRRPPRSASSSAAPTRAPGSRTPPPRPCNPTPRWYSPRQVVAPLFDRAGPGRPGGQR